MTHLTAERAGQWAAGVLDEAELDSIAAHLGVCPSCEALAQREAQLDARLFDALAATHVTADEAGQWAAGLLDRADAERVERHAVGCATCDERLRREARTEVALQRAAGSAPRRRWLVVVPLAAAAALAMLLARAPADVVSVESSDGGSFELVDGTHFHGESPPPEAFTATAPFSL